MQLTCAIEIDDKHRTNTGCLTSNRLTIVTISSVTPSRVPSRVSASDIQSQLSASPSRRLFSSQSRNSQSQLQSSDLVASVSSLPSGSGGGGGGTSISSSRATELSKIVGAQIVVLVSTIKEDKFDATAKQIRQLCNQHGPEVYQKYFRRLVTIVQTSSPHSQEQTLIKRLIREEVSILSVNPSLSFRFADSVSLTDSDAFKDFQLEHFFDDQSLDALQRTVLCLAFKNSSNQNLKVQAFDILARSFGAFLTILSDRTKYSQNLSEQSIVTLINQHLQEPVLPYFDIVSTLALYSSVKARYAPSIPSAIMTSVELNEDHLDSLSKLVASFGPSTLTSVQNLEYENSVIVRIANEVTDPDLLHEFIQFKPYFFTLDLFSYLARRGQYPIKRFIDELLVKDQVEFVSAILKFLDIKSATEYQLLQQHQQQDSQVAEFRANTLPLHVEVVHELLNVLLTQNIPLELVDRWELVQAQCIQTYPRLINFGRGHDAAILANANTNTIGFSTDVEKQMKYYYQRMYEQEMSISELISLLQTLRSSDDPLSQDVFACMVHSLFDEYRFFPDYPLSALATTAVLFGSIIQFHLVEDMPLAVALRFVLKALKESPDAKMFKFGLQALMQFQSRLDNFPQYCSLLLQIPSLEAVQPQLMIKLRTVAKGESALEESSLEQANGTASPPPPPPFRSLHLDTIGPSDLVAEDPNEDIQDKVLFIVNNIAQNNVEPKSLELKTILEEKYYQWFASYLVDTRAKQEPNYHGIYIRMLDVISDPHLYRQILHNTYASIISLLNSQETILSSTERGRLKNLGCWLGILTIARDRPIKHKNIYFKELLVEGFDTNRLIVVLPFICKVLEQSAKSRIFKPPSPWLMGILRLMVELYQFADLKLNLKFEIEVLCKNLDLDLAVLEPSTIIRDRPSKSELMNALAIQYTPDVTQDFERLNLTAYNNRAEGRPRPADAISIPSVGTNYSQAASAFNTHPSLKKLLQLSIEKAIRELINPVVERSDTIAQIATKELIMKDFALEPDEEKLRKAAHNMVEYLASSLALVTCKEPLRLNIGSNLRALLASSGYAETAFPAEVLNAAINEHLDAACLLIQKTASDKAKADVDELLGPAYLMRRRHREQRPNQPFIGPQTSRYALSLPDPFRLKPPGLTRQQLMVYEDFGKAKVGNVGPDIGPNNEFSNVDYPGAMSGQSHFQQQAQQQHQLLGSGQTSVLQSGLLGQAPVSQTQQRMVPLMQQQQQQPPHQLDPFVHPSSQISNQQLTTDGQPFTAQYMNRAGQNKVPAVEQALVSMQSAIDTLLKYIKDTPETSFNVLPADHRIKITVNSILSVANRHPVRDPVIHKTSQLTVNVLFTIADSQLARETLAFLLARLCDLSSGTAKEVVLWLIHSDDERKFNVPVMITLMKMGLIHPQELDVNLAKQLQTRAPAAVEFIANLIHESILGESPCALRTDFTLCLEALEILASDTPPDLIAQQLLASLENAVTGHMPPEDSTSSLKDQMRYIFNEWIRLTQHPAQSEKMLLIFIYQMSEHGLLDGSRYLGVFFRSALEFCQDAYAKDMQALMAQSNTVLSPKDGVIAVDNLAKLVMMLFKIHEESEETSKVQYLRGILGVFCLVFADAHETEAESFNSQPFFRLFSSLLCEWAEIEDAYAEHKEQFFTLMTDVLKALQPLAFPGFTFAWMTLISHRMFMPKILQLEQRKGWPMFSDLLGALLKFTDIYITGSELPNSIRFIYKGTLRIVLVLLHDIPEFLVQYHYTLCTVVNNLLSI